MGVPVVIGNCVTYDVAMQLMHAEGLACWWESVRSSMHVSWRPGCWHSSGNGCRGCCRTQRLPARDGSVSQSWRTEEL